MDCGKLGISFVLFYFEPIPAPTNVCCKTGKLNFFSNDCLDHTKCYSTFFKRTHRLFVFADVGAYPPVRNDAL